MDGTPKQIRVAALVGMGFMTALMRVSSHNCELLMHAEYVPPLISFHMIRVDPPL